MDTAGPGWPTEKVVQAAYSKMSKKRASKKKQSKQAKRSFGGRATSGGVGYEVDVAAWMAVKMLAGGAVEIIDGLAASAISGVALQTHHAIDDVVLYLRDAHDAKVCISAKKRTGSVSLGPGSGLFAEVVESMVQQYHDMQPAARLASHFVWAQPSTAGRDATHWLPEALKAYRAEAPVDDLSDFLARRTSKERKPVEVLVQIIKRKWRQIAGAVPSSDIIQAITSRIHVAVLDFDSGSYHERLAQKELGDYVVTTSSDGIRAWERLVKEFSEANRRGFKRTSQHLRWALSADNIRLKSDLDYAKDVEALKNMTKRNMGRLRDHRYLRFGSTPADEVTLPRENDAQALINCVTQGHRLLTGEPGCGKSGLIHRLVEELQFKGCPVVLVLAEDFGGYKWTKHDGIPELHHPWDDVLAHWPDGAPGYLITDALDAVRDPRVLGELKNLLGDVLRGDSNWTVIASVREYDLKYGHHFRELFPGEGSGAHASKDFAGVSHFHLGRLREEELDHLVETRPEIGLFIQSARASQRSEQLHRSPFFLRLAADMLKADVEPQRLADWNSPTLLLRRFWDVRVEDDGGEGDRETVLQAICQEMMSQRSMLLSVKELGFNSAQRAVVNDLRSRGILQGPALQYGARINGEVIRFSHHLLHDYVMAKSVIPSVAVRFVSFAQAKPLMPVFYRQSFLMALDELWDGCEGPEGFWRACLELEGCPRLHSFTRILAPLVAARRVTSSDDLLPLVNRIRQSLVDDSPAMKAALHLSSGLQDAAPELIRLGASAWCEYAKKIGELLPRHPALEGPLVELLGRLINIEAAASPSDQECINMAGCRLLELHLSKPVNRGWRFAADRAMMAICRTFKRRPLESKQILLALLAPERVALFPHEDIFDLAQELKYLPREGDEVIRRVFEVSFSTEPEPGERRNSGSIILPLMTETRQDWTMNRYCLGEYYQVAHDLEPGLATTLVCIAWNEAEKRRTARWEMEQHVFQSTFTLRGISCTLNTDGCSSWGREFENEENTILDSFEDRLRRWCEQENNNAFTAAVDAFALVNRSAVMWQTLLEIGSEHPDRLGVLLEDAVHEPLILTMPAYRYGGAALFAALHKTGNQERRKRLERTLLSLPSKTPILEGSQRDPTPSWIVYSQNVILGELDEAKLVLEETKDLWRSRRANNELERNDRPESLTPYVPSISGSPILEPLAEVDPVAASITAMAKPLEAIRARPNEFKATSSTVKADLQLLRRAERLVKKCAATHSEQTAELWGRLTQACSRLAGRRLPHGSETLLLFIRGILLRAASDPVPEISEQDAGTDDHMVAWGWPSPRSDASEGLPFLVCRLNKIDRSIIKALRLLAGDGSRIVRWHLARSIHALRFHAPELIWELADAFIERETKFQILADLAGSLSNLLSKNEKETLERLKRISDRAKAAPDDHDIHDRLTCCFLFYFLRTGNALCWSFIAEQIDHCDKEANASALSAQLHDCRTGRWLTAGDAVTSDPKADEQRARTWGFVQELLFAAQSKLKEKREQLQLLHAENAPDGPHKHDLQTQAGSLLRLVNKITDQLYFASGTFAEKQKNDEDSLSIPQTRRFWVESADLFESLANEPHPAIAQHVVESMTHLMDVDPRRTFLCAAKSIETSNAWGFSRERLAVDPIVNLVQRLLSDHREVLHSPDEENSECLEALLRILDLFVEAGWLKARQLTHRLEEIYR